MTSGAKGSMLAAHDLRMWDHSADIELTDYATDIEFITHAPQPLDACLGCVENRNRFAGLFVRRAAKRSTRSGRATTASDRATADR
jgi:hypothetical protein